MVVWGPGSGAHDERLSCGRHPCRAPHVRRSRPPLNLPPPPSSPRSLPPQKQEFVAAISKPGPCLPGYYQADPKSPCTVCGEDAYCPGGKLGKKIEVSTKTESERRTTPPREWSREGRRLPPSPPPTHPLPPPPAHRPSTLQCPAGYSTAGVTTAAASEACFIVCDPGSYAAITTGPEATCYVCGPGFVCPGGPQGKEQGWRGAGEGGEGRRGKRGSRPPAHAHTHFFFKKSHLLSSSPCQSGRWKGASPATSASPLSSTTPRASPTA